LELYSAHVKNLIEKERTGRRAYLYDAQGKPLFRLTIKNGERQGPDASVRPAVFGPGGNGGIERFLGDAERRNRVDTTLVPELQRVAWDALRNYRGAVVILAAD